MKRPVKKHISAGGLLVNGNNTKAYLIHKRERDHWQLPKGHVNNGETILETALREVYEETGYKNLTHIFPEEVVKIEYDFELEREPQFLHHKTVHFF